jgi:hypothetical protein
MGGRDRQHRSYQHGEGESQNGFHGEVMVITIWLRNGTHSTSKRSQKEVGHLAEMAATQTDDHRDKRWSLSLRGKTLDPWASSEDAGIEEMDELELVEYSPPKPGLLKRTLTALGVTS